VTTRRRVLGWSVLVTVIAASCAGGGPSRAEVMNAYGREAAIPRLEDHADSSRAVVDAIAAVCAAPTESVLADAIGVVDDARARWLATEAHWTGPVMERRSAAVTDWPVNGAEIEELVAGSTPGEIDVDVVSRRVGADNRGLSALRWVLARDDAGALLDDERWCDYLTANAEVIQMESDLIVGDWTESWEDGPAFVDLVADGDETERWLGMLVNDNTFLAHRLTEAPDDEGDAPPVDVAADRVAQLAGLREVAVELGPLLGDELEARLLAEIDAAAAAYETGDVDEGRTLATEVERTLATDVAGKLGVTIGFSDADGDSAG
jgi:predicted lipoprotein